MKQRSKNRDIFKVLVEKHGINEALYYQTLTSDEKLRYKIAQRALRISPREFMFRMECRDNFMTLDELEIIFGSRNFVKKTIKKFEMLLREEISEEQAEYYLSMAEEK